MRHRRTRIVLDPQPAGLLGLFEVAGDFLVVRSQDEILFRLAGPVAQLVCLSSRFGTDAGLSDASKGDTQPCVSDCKVWIEFYCALKERYGFGVSRGELYLRAGTESFESFKRRCSSLLKRCIEFPERADRLAEFVPDFRSGLS